MVDRRGRVKVGKVVMDPIEMGEMVSLLPEGLDMMVKEFGETRVTQAIRVDTPEGRVEQVENFVGMLREHRSDVLTCK